MKNAEGMDVRTVRGVKNVPRMVKVEVVSEKRGEWRWKLLCGEKMLLVWDGFKTAKEAKQHFIFFRQVLQHDFSMLEISKGKEPKVVYSAHHSAP